MIEQQTIICTEVAEGFDEYLDHLTLLCYSQYNTTNYLMLSLLLTPKIHTQRCEWLNVKPL